MIEPPELQETGASTSSGSILVPDLGDPSQKQRRVKDPRRKQMVARARKALASSVLRNLRQTANPPAERAEYELDENIFAKELIDPDREPEPEPPARIDDDRAWVLARLGADLSPEDRAELIDRADSVDWPEALRPEVVQGVWEHALVLRNRKPDDYERSLAIAVRVLAILAPGESIARMLELLRPTDPPSVKQIGLSGLRIMLSAGPPRQPPAALAKRLNEMIGKHLDEELATSTEIAALAMGAFVAAVGLGRSGMKRRARGLAVLEPLLVDQVKDDLRTLAAQWRRRNVPAATAAMKQLEDVLHELGD